MEPYYFPIEAIGPSDIFSFVTFICIVLLVMVLVITHVTLSSHSPFACLYFQSGRFPDGLEMASEGK